MQNPALAFEFFVIIGIGIDFHQKQDRTQFGYTMKKWGVHYSEQSSADQIISSQVSVDTQIKIGKMRDSRRGRLAQLVEQCPYKAWVTSSSLVPPTKSTSVLDR